MTNATYCAFTLPGAGGTTLMCGEDATIDGLCFHHAPTECEWFLNCTKTAVNTIEHPTIGPVGACQQHTDFAVEGGPTALVPPMVARRAKESGVDKLMRGELDA